LFALLLLAFASIVIISIVIKSLVFFYYAVIVLVALSALTVSFHQISVSQRKAVWVAVPFVFILGVVGTYVFLSFLK
jgi:hypothetical protein